MEKREKAGVRGKRSDPVFEILGAERE